MEACLPLAGFVAALPVEAAVVGIEVDLRAANGTT